MATLTITWANVQNTETVSFPLSGGTNLVAGTDTYQYFIDGVAGSSPGGDLPAGITNILCSNFSGITATVTLEITIGSGYFTRLGGDWTSSGNSVGNTRLESIIPAAGREADWGLGTTDGTIPGLTSLEEFLKNCTYISNDGAGSSIPQTCPTTIVNMKDAFNGATNFNLVLDRWTTSNVTDMTDMFNGASSFAQSIRGWDTSSATATSAGGSNAYANMFLNATAMASAFSLSLIHI